MKQLLLLGGGHAHVEVLRAFALQPVEGWRITLASPFPQLIYSGMVPGIIAGHYGVAECAIDLAALCQRAGAKLRRATASLVDPARREVTFSDAGSAPYDLLSLDIGGKTAGAEARGVAHNAVVIRPLESAIDAWKKVLSGVSKGTVGSVTLVGAGAAGIEVALAMDHRLKADFGEHAPHVRVLGDRAPLAEIPRDARNMLLACVRKQGIGLHTGTAVTEVGADFVQLEGGLQFASDATFWTAGTAPPDLARDSGFATDDRGFFLTNDFLQSVSHADVFAAGDCASRQGRDLPKAGVIAVRAAPTLAANLRAAMTGGPIVAHRTGKRYLALISAGSKNAVGYWNGFAWDGAWAWRWKDRIDRAFVAKYAS